MTEEIRLPGNAFDAEKGDVLKPTVAVLRELHLLPSQEELNQAGKMSAVFGGPPQSVAVIEAGATAFAKWWAAGLGAAVAGVSGSIVAFWDKQGGDTQRMIVLAVGIAVAALILAIGYIVGSDTRGRAAAAVAVTEARVQVAETVLRVARGREPADEESAPTITPLPFRAMVTFRKEAAADEQGWTALAMKTKSGGDLEYLLVKGAQRAWADADDVHFLPPG